MTQQDGERARQHPDGHRNQGHLGTYGRVWNRAGGGTGDPGMSNASDTGGTRSDR